MAVRSYRELIVWQRAMELAVEVYECTKRFPRDEIYALTSQMRRAAVSVASNIAEGQGRGMGADFRHFLRISQGSFQELETQLMLAERLGYISAEELSRTLHLAEEVCRLNRGLQASISD